MTGAPDPLGVPTWVVGAGGLLGSAVTRRLRRGHAALTTPPHIPWADPTAAVHALQDEVARLARSGPFRVVWCAGAGVTGTSASALLEEGRVWGAFLDALEAQGPGAVQALFMASSAGGLYAGSPGPPFTEAHPVVPISPYGDTKQAAEAAARRFATASGTPTVIARIANLYGPGQDLGKQQGLISHLCRAQITGEPASVFVSLDTIRDYLFVDDCAAMVVDALDQVPSLIAGPDAPSPAVTKIFASQQPTTIAALIGECRRVFRRPLRVALGSSPAARFQTRDLRVRSVAWGALDRRALTPLPAGIRATHAGLLRALQSTTTPAPWPQPLPTLVPAR